MHVVHVQVRTLANFSMCCIVDIVGRMSSTICWSSTIRSINLARPWPLQITTTSRRWNNHVLCLLNFKHFPCCYFHFTVLWALCFNFMSVNTYWRNTVYVYTVLHTKCDSPVIDKSSENSILNLWVNKCKTCNDVTRCRLAISRDKVPINYHFGIAIGTLHRPASRRRSV